MNDKDFLFWLQGVIELKLKFKDSPELEDILQEIVKHNTEQNADTAKTSTWD
jgi:hypothetical protein